MSNYLIDELIKIVISYLREFDQIRIRLVTDKPVTGDFGVDFYTLFADFDIKGKDVFYRLYASVADIPRFRNRFTINKKIAYLRYPDSFVKKLFIRSKTLETLIIDAGEIEKLIIKAPKLHTLAVYGFGAKNIIPVMLIQESVKILLLNCNHRITGRLDKKMIKNYKKSGTLEIEEFYTDFNLLEYTGKKNNDADFVNYINPKILWLTGCPDSLSEVSKSGRLILVSDFF